jgi:hypothetical protein
MADSAICHPLFAIAARGAAHRQQSCDVLPFDLSIKTALKEHCATAADVAAGVGSGTNRARL